MKLTNGFIKYKGKRIRQTKEGRFEADMGRSSGRHIRKRFETLNEAKAFVDENTAEALAMGVGITAFTQTERERFAKAVAQLDAYNATLEDAVAFYVQHHQEVSTEMSMRHHISLYLIEKRGAGLRPRSLSDIESMMMRLESRFARESVEQITATELDKWFDVEVAGATARANLKRYTAGFFNWLVKNGTIGRSPVADTRQIKQGNKTPAIYTSKQIQSIMTACAAFERKEKHPMAQEMDKETITAWFVLAAFSGVRPTEATRVEWSDIDLELGEIHIRSEVSKTRDERIALLPPNALKWMIPRRKPSGLVFPYSDKTLTRWRRDIMDTAGVKPIQDGLRHTSASMSVCVNGIDETAISHGHSTEVLFKHYHGLVKSRKAQAEAFYKIVPSAKGKIIAIGGAA
jgi:integrase